MSVKIEEWKHFAKIMKNHIYIKAAWKNFKNLREKNLNQFLSFWKLKSTPASKPRYNDVIFT